MMKFILSVLLLVIFSQSAFPQMRIIYGIKQDGKESKTDSIVVYISKESMQITRPVLIKEKQYIDFVNKQTVQTLIKDDNSFYSCRKNYTESKPEIVHEYPEILGYHCMKSLLSIRSNKIEVYYTDETEYKGAPILYLADVPGIVLKVVRNGNYEIYAKQIDISDDYANMSKYPAQNLTEINESVFQQKLIESRYNTFEIFSNENLSFNEAYVNDFSKDIIKTSKGTIALRKVNLPATTKNTIIIAELSVRSNGDAYDRTGSVFAIPETNKKNILEAFEKGISVLPDYNNGMTMSSKYEPPVELMRFITSFGTGYFGKDLNINGLNWKDSIVY
ncbi:MAG: PNGase F N-terminal domain-containing protein, partial [Ignavibacteriota bacterium]